MKLYTEEQLWQAMDFARGYHGMSDTQFIETLTPIELPSDEDIDIASCDVYREYPNNPKDMPQWMYGKDINAHRKRKAFIKGAKWMRYKIQGGQNEQ